MSTDNQRKLKTISEVCGEPPGSFAAFIAAERTDLKAAQDAADARLRKALKKPARNRAGEEGRA